MRNVASLAEAALNRKPEQPSPGISDDAVAQRVFRALHGFHGNLFMSKFATGEKNERGEDKGMLDTRTIWGKSLRKYDLQTVLAALARSLEVHVQYPPNLPQFLVLCEACKPVAISAPPTTAIPMSGALRSKYAAKAMALNEKHAEKLRNALTGYRPLPPGLNGLKQAIADAVGAAGGDEGAELIRLDRLFAKASS